ncbi:transporter substrate-binding domain-containing protein [Halarcobacter sp.]|uniref:transporter substrate-binding domain-containing protein n=1 Tax=Halarcobacter sp. TaxID=2321133 RepID=UPI002AA6F5F7|nr:transporter substrate-binding domain-containing protein [Halarcobacter sp.]
MFKIFFFLTTLFTILLKADNPLFIVYEERIPYVEKYSNSIKGLVATPVLKALQYSGVKYKLKEKPSKRHLYEIKANINKMCAIGWFKNIQREEFAKFTHPLYQDKPLGIISRKENENILKNISVDNLLKNRNLSLLSKASYSYGSFLDEKIKNFKTIKKEVYTNNKKMLSMIVAKRADYLFISEEEAKILLNDKAMNNLKFFSVKNIPKGNKRYLICSKNVSNETIKLINKYIKPLK